MKWFKFYGQDWLTDLKIMKMKLEDRMCYITLLCLASSAEEGGLIRNCDENTLIELTHLSDEHYDNAKGCLKRYEALHCVTLGVTGDVTLLNFSRRQDENLSNAERQKKYRERLKITTKPRNTHNITQSNDSNARIEQNRTDKNRIDTTKAEASSAEIVKIIDLFKDVNPSYSKWYANKTQRAACKRLLDLHGLEKLQNIIPFLPASNKTPYIPNATTPLQLEDKWASIENAWAKKKIELKTKERNVII